jgi:type IV pilus assembly protein PilA
MHPGPPEVLLTAEWYNGPQLWVVLYVTVWRFNSSVRCAGLTGAPRGRWPTRPAAGPDTTVFARTNCRYSKFKDRGHRVSPSERRVVCHLGDRIAGQGARLPGRREEKQDGLAPTGYPLVAVFAAYYRLRCQRTKRGFLMRYVNRIAALAGISLAACGGGSPGQPASSDPTAMTRAAVEEGLGLADDAKARISQSFQAGGMDGVKAAATLWNSQQGNTGANSKYVTNVFITAATGVITVQYSANVPEVSGQTLVLMPSINKEALAPGASGAIDWGCASRTSATATSRGLPVTAGTVASQYAPVQCQ